MDIKQIERINAYEWEIKMSAQPWMRVPVRIFSDESMLKAALQDRSLEQAVNAAALPGLVGRVCVMPDVHQGRLSHRGCRRHGRGKWWDLTPDCLRHQRGVRC